MVYEQKNFKNIVPVDSILTYELLDEMYAWCIACPAKTQFAYDWFKREFYFESEHDALLFKLQWAAE